MTKSSVTWPGEKTVSKGTWTALLRLYRVYRISLDAEHARIGVGKQNELLLNPPHRAAKASTQEQHEALEG